MTKLTWPTVGFLAVIGAVVAVLGVFTDWTSGEIITVAALLLGTGGGAAIVGTVAGRVDDVHAETTAQTRTLEKIDHQTNGVTEAERLDIAVKAVAEAKRQGLL